MTESQPVFQIEKVYVKDLSLEIPNAPQVFVQAGEAPQIEVQIANQAAGFAEGLFEVTVSITVTARAADKTMFLAEVHQAGIFTVRGISETDIEPLLGIACPNILYPYAREAIADLVTRAGFPTVVLQPVAFEAIYAQRQQQQADAGPSIEIAR